MNTVTGIPDAAWYLARLETASPRPPVRAYGESSGARCTTGAGVPSGRTSGASGAPGVGVACTSVLRVRLGRRVDPGRSVEGSGTPADELGAITAPPAGSGAIGDAAPGIGDDGTMSIEEVRRRGMTPLRCKKIAQRRDARTSISSRPPDHEARASLAWFQTDALSYHTTRARATSFARLRSDSPTSNIR